MWWYIQCLRQISLDALIIGLKATTSFDQFHCSIRSVIACFAPHIVLCQFHQFSLIVDLLSTKDNLWHAILLWNQATLNKLRKQVGWLQVLHRTPFWYWEDKHFQHPNFGWLWNKVLVYCIPSERKHFKMSKSLTMLTVPELKRHLVSWRLVLLWLELPVGYFDRNSWCLNT